MIEGQTREPKIKLRQAPVYMKATASNNPESPTAEAMGRSHVAQLPSATLASSVPLAKSISGVRSSVRPDPLRRLHMLRRLRASQRTRPAFVSTSHRKTEPNQAPEPTSLRVTDCAFAHSAPRRLAAHL